jgi:archaeosine synthase beta-subunit
MAPPCPESAPERDRWILALRPPRVPANPWLPHAAFTEEECAADGSIVPVNTLFLTNRECPWHCLMCDLWQHSLTETVPPGAIPAQIDHALNALPSGRHLKLYNGGSFFDPQAIPVSEYGVIAQRARRFERVIVESHPRLVGDRTLRFQDQLTAPLEVAMGLEIAQPQFLARLNKRMTLDQFGRTALWLRQHHLDLRVFILVKPPFLHEPEALTWAQKSLEFAFNCGATVVSLIPTRFGNGALEVLAAHGDFAPPKLSTLEAALEYGLDLRRGRVFADTWNLELFSDCPHCFPARAARLRQMNLRQQVSPSVSCNCHA